MHRIELQERVKTRDRKGFNEATYEWKTRYTLWARADGFIGREIIRTDRLTSEKVYKFEIQYISEINQDWRIKLGERIFDIGGIINVRERNRALEITALEVD